MKTINTVLLSFICATSVLYAAEISYPYHVAPERSAAIIKSANQLQLGMTAKQVETLLGAPDERNNTFDHIKKSQTHKIGYSFVYLLQRMRADGSAAQKDEKLLRLHFGLDNQLKRIDDQTK